jgi:hypothetical protein
MLEHRPSKRAVGPLASPSTPVGRAVRLDDETVRGHIDIDCITNDRPCYARRKSGSAAASSRLIKIIIIVLLVILILVFVVPEL